ncbi:MAG: helicase-related protein, partial [Nocardioidaceae bacterium]
VQVVVATVVAARGVHVDSVGRVVQFDAPTDAKAYLHRSGRTARAGASGAVVTITTPRQLDEVVRLHGRAGVTSRHHDIRSTPRPMTAEALGQSGAPAPEAPRGRGGSGGRRSSGGRPAQGGRTAIRGARQGTRPERPAPRSKPRPASGRRRWDQADRRRRTGA